MQPEVIAANMVAQQLIVFICIAANQNVPAVYSVVQTWVSFLLLLFWRSVAAKQLFNLYRIFFVFDFFVKRINFFNLLFCNFNIVNKIIRTRNCLFVLFIIISGIFLCRFFRIY